MQVKIQTTGVLPKLKKWLPQRISNIFKDTVDKFVEAVRENMEEQGFPTDGPMYQDITVTRMGDYAIVEFVPYAAVHEFGAQWKMTKAQQHKIRRLIEEGILEEDYEPPRRGWITIPARPFIRPALLELKIEGEILP